jgi:heme/copper-type cytochrome/quinol oxidase subunit 2
MTVRAFNISVLALGLCALLLVSDAGAQGCAMCKTAIGGPGDPLASGINTSIMFMMAMPFVLFAAVGGWLTYMFWGYRATAAGEAGETPDLPFLSSEREGSR